MAETKTGAVSLGNITNSVKQYIRILQLTRKPSMDEFLMISKVAGAGIVLIGVVGFIIWLIMVPLAKTVLNI